MRRIIIGAAALAAIAAFAGRPAQADPAPKVCILFEDDSFACGTADPVGGWLDLSQPRIVGCIPHGICDDAEPGGPEDPYVQVLGAQ